MAGGELIDLLLELREEKRRYYSDPLRYARKIKDVVRSLDPHALVFLFGSFVRGTMRPDSDIDVLVVTSMAADVWKRVRVMVEVKRAIGDLAPFQIHVVTPEELEGWYRRFIDAMVEV
ncbi:MAG: nucleotidyltransferase domain-containing protein [Nitrososphaerota archaeon]